MIYFDYAATSLKRRDVFEKILENFELFDGNPDSLHKYGRDAKKILNESRDSIADSINANPKDIVFTSGASESNNTIISNFKSQKIITTQIEHPSVLNSIKSDDVIYLKVGENGSIDFDEFKKAYNPDVKLVSIMYVNNETGVIQPVEEIGNFLKDTDTWFHVDAVQAYSHIDIDVEKLNCDSLSISAHKIGAINGFGILYSRKRFNNLIYGGEQESYRRAGTSFVMGAYTMSESFKKAINERDKISEIKRYFVDRLKNSAIEYEINGDIENETDHIINLYLPFVKSDFLLTYLDINKIAASAGSACSAGSLSPSHVISSMYDTKRAMHSIRFSFGFSNSKQDIDKLIDILTKLYNRRSND